MTGPITRPAEIERLTALANNDPYRTEVILSLASLREGQKRTDDRWQKAQEWMVKHDKDDALRFASIEATLEDIVDEANDYGQNKQQLLGAKKLIVGIAAVIGAIGACVLGLIEIARWWKG